MSFLFGAGRERRSEFADHRRRAEQHLARDVGDDKAFNMDARTRRRTPLWPVIVLAIVMTLGAFGLLPRINTFEIVRDCDTPSFILDSYDVPPGSGVAVKATGPDAGDYLLVSGDGAITSRDGTVDIAGGAVLTDVFQMGNCQAQAAFTAPTEQGNHTIRMLRRSGGEFAEVSAVSLTVGR